MARPQMIIDKFGAIAISTLPTIPGNPAHIKVLSLPMLSESIPPTIDAANPEKTGALAIQAPPDSVMGMVPLASSNSCGTMIPENAITCPTSRWSEVTKNAAKV
uniref:Uncharacterized protein n=1 Tax=Photinus pyralis TaxID=7054 RepID=A0A1Y1KTQ1_PHOPY